MVSLYSHHNSMLVGCERERQHRECIWRRISVDCEKGMRYLKKHWQIELGCIEPLSGLSNAAKGIFPLTMLTGWLAR